MGVQVVGLGSSVLDNIVTNEDLASLGYDADDDLHFLQMAGQPVFKWAVRVLSETISDGGWPESAAKREPAWFLG